MSAARGYLGAGDLYVNRIVGGIAQGWEGPFESNKFEIKANSELKESTSRGRYTYGQINESVPVPKPFDLNVTMTEVGKTGLALALMGTASVFHQAAGTLAAEPVVLKTGKWGVLTKANFTGTVTVTNAAGTTTYDEGDDYIVNRAMGWVQLVAGGGIADGDSVKVSGAYGEITDDVIAGATQTSVRAMFRLDGVNFADGLATLVDVYEAIITSDSAIDFLGDNFNTIPLKGRMKTPVGKTEPFKVARRQAA